MTDGVHTFDSLANGRSAVKESNKGLQTPVRNATIERSVPHHALEMNLN